MHIKHKDILIRNAEITDAKTLCKWWSDGKVMAHAGFPRGLDTSVLKIENQINESTDSNRILIIEYKDQAIGECNYKEIEYGLVDIGIKICLPSYRNRGLGRIVLSLLIKELFKSDYKTISLSTTPENHRSRHVYKLLGFEEIRVDRNSWIDQDGNLRTALYYELKEENFHDFS